MTPEQIIAECEAVLKAGGDGINLVIPKGKSMRLPGFPRGELLCENGDGNRVVRYNAKRVLEAILKATTGIEVRVLTSPDR